MTNSPDAPTERPKADEGTAAIRSIQARLRALTVAVWILALAVLLTGAAVFGNLVNYFAGEPLMFGGASVGAALLGFAFGWLARRAA